MDWEREKANWPNSDKSRFVRAAETIWHVQQTLSDKTGRRGNLLMLHGSGATTHSFTGLHTQLESRFDITMIDLPGHGFTGHLGNGSPDLETVTRSIAVLLKQQGIQPDYIIGHSAGAAIAVHMAHRKLCNLQAIVSINGAFFPFPGFAGHIFPMAAKLLFLNPFVPKLFAFSANENSVERLLSSTGSSLSEQQLALYQKAFQSSRHVEGTLALMANWNLESMADELTALDTPLLQIIGEVDGTISPYASVKVQELNPASRRIMFPNAGHLVHEEMPCEVAKAILGYFDAIEPVQDMATCAS